MRLEVEIRIDPVRRADRFVEDWQALRRQRDHVTGRNARSVDSVARALSSQMSGMAKSLERDPQLESLLRNRKAALGIDLHARRSIAHELASIAGRARQRTLGIGI